MFQKCKILTVVLFSIVGGVSALAGDVTRGVTFTTTASAALLHQLVDNATINTTLYSGKPLGSSGALSDTILILQSGTFYRETASTFFGPLISGQALYYAPLSTDQILVYDPNAAVFRKLSVTNLINYTTNLFRSFPYTAPFTNLTAETAPQSVTALFASESFAPNVRISPHNILYGWTAVADYNNLTANSKIGITVPSGAEAGDLVVSLQNLASYLTIDGFMFGGSKFQSFDYPITTVNAQVVQTNHGLTLPPQISRWVMVCQTNDTGGWVIGDEVPVDQFHLGPSGVTNSFGWGNNSTSVWLTVASTNFNVRSKTNAADVNVNTLRWKARNYSYQFY